MKDCIIFEKVRVRVRVRSSKIEVRCASACETNIEVRVCVRRTVQSLATQHLLFMKIGSTEVAFDLFRLIACKKDIQNFDNR